MSKLISVLCLLLLVLKTQAQQPNTPTGNRPMRNQPQPVNTAQPGATGFNTIPNMNPGQPSLDPVIGSPAVEGLSRRDPFKMPEYLIIKLRQKMAKTLSGTIDDTIDAIRRWPLGSYQLVGIIWDVKRPKVMFMDPANSIHMVQVNDFIGNAKGVVTSIQSGSVTVLEGKIPQIIKLKK